MDAAWTLINSANGQSGDGGRSGALKTLISNNASLAGIDLSNATLVDAQFRSAYLPDAKFNKADLRGASFACPWWKVIRLNKITTCTNLVGASFTGANLSGSDFWDSNLASASFAGGRHFRVFFK